MPKKNKLKERIEEAMRKHENKETIMLKYIGDDHRKPRPQTFREAIEWIFELLDELADLRARIDRIGFTTNENPTHNITCSDDSCYFNRNNKCTFVTFAGERTVAISKLHKCMQYQSKPGSKGTSPTKKPRATLTIKKKKRKGSKKETVDIINLRGED